MVSSGMLCHVALVRTDVSEELSASFIRVTRIGELGTRNNIPEDTIPQTKIVLIEPKYLNVFCIGLEVYITKLQMFYV
jgi:hypothetical protein